MGMESQPPTNGVVGPLMCDFCPSKPEFRWKEGPLHHAVPPAVHVVEGLPQVINTAVPDCEGQEYGLVTGEVLMELRQSLEETPSPCPASAPLAEGAEAAVAGVSAPKDRLTLLRPLQWDLHANRGRAIADSSRDVQRVGIHGEVPAYGAVVPPVLAVGLQDPKMGTGRGSNTAWTWQSMHLVCVWWNRRMLPSTNYIGNPRKPSGSLGLRCAGPPPGV